MRFLIAAGLVFSSSLCLAEDFSSGNVKDRVVNNEHALTVKQAAELASNFEGDLRLRGLTSIDKDVAQELSKAKGDLRLKGLTSIDQDVAQELSKARGRLYLKGLTSIDKDVARELAKYEGALLYLHGRTSIDELGLAYLKSNPNIHVPEKYRN